MERFTEKPTGKVRVVTADGKQYGETCIGPHNDHKDVVWVRWEGAVKPRPAGWRMLRKV